MEVGAFCLVAEVGLVEAVATDAKIEDFELWVVCGELGLPGVLVGDVVAVGEGVAEGGDAEFGGAGLEWVVCLVAADGLLVGAVELGVLVGGGAPAECWVVEDVVGCVGGDFLCALDLFGVERVGWSEFPVFEVFKDCEAGE